MKKMFVILLAFMLLLGLCACGQDAPAEEDVQIDAQPKVQETSAVEQTDAPVVEATAAPTEDPAAAAEKEIQEKKALAESCIDKDVSELYALIGEPESSDYAPSCLVQGGEDGMLYYDGFVVYTTREGDVETVYYVE